MRLSRSSRATASAPFSVNAIARSKTWTSARSCSVPIIDSYRSDVRASTRSWKRSRHCTAIATVLRSSW